MLLPWLLVAPQQPQRFAASVSTVRVDVIVTDEEGQFVGDLRAEDFRLYEDGALREIRGVQLVDVSLGEVERLGETARVKGAVARRTVGSSPSELGAVIMVLDVPGLFLQNKIRYESALENALSEVDNLDLPHAVYLIDGAGKLRQLQALTTDADALRRAAEAAGEVPAVQLLHEDLLHRGALDLGDRTSASTRLARGEERRRTAYTYRLLRSFVDALAHRSGRTALVWVSTGVDMASAEVLQRRPYGRLDEQDFMPMEPFPSYSPDGEIRRLQEELYRAANTANVSIYSVDPTALHEFYVVDTGLTQRIGKVSDFRGNSLRHAAAATGGEAYIGWTELERVLESIESDTGRFYLLNYAPAPGSNSGDYHEIRVQVDRPDINVRARAGYVWYSDAERRSRILQGALALPGTASGLDVSVQTIRAREPDGQPILIVDTLLRTDGNRTPAMAGIDPRSLLVYGTVRNERADLVAQVDHQRFAPGASGGPGSPAAAAGSGDWWTHRVVHHLDAGKYYVRVAAIDPSSERVGAAGVDVEIRDVGDTWDVSDPWLAIQYPDGSRSAVLDGKVRPGHTVVVYFEVYNGVSPTVGGRVLPTPLRGDPPYSDTELAQDTERAPSAVPGTPSIKLVESDGVHSGWVPLRNLPAGSYTLELEINDIGAGRARTFRLHLWVVDSTR